MPQRIPLYRGNYPPALAVPHFPAPWQAVIFRMWGIVPFSTLAKVLQMEEEKLIEEGKNLGLPFPVEVDKFWREKSYLSIIRNVWHLLTIPQILLLLEWKEEQLFRVLEEEDFFWSKLGRLKPDTGGACLYSPLTEEEKKRTKEIKVLLDSTFPEEEKRRKEKIFSFMEKYEEDLLSFPLSEGKSPYSFSFTIIHSYAASCGDVFLDIEKQDPVPDSLLRAYSAMGITGIWIHALLYLFYPIKGAEEFSLHWEKRLQNLKKVAKKCKEYGLELFLYFNEPRSMPMAFYEKKPHWGGWKLPTGDGMTMCINRSPEVLEYLEKGMEFLFGNVPDLGGIFAITMSENPTNCFYSNQKENCPYCKDVPGEKIIADILSAMERGMHKGKSSAKFLAYDWAWRLSKASTNNAPFKKKVLDLLPTRGMIASSVSEWGKMLHIGGVEVYLKDYSLSQVGPGEEAKAFWEHAGKRGMERCAKIQINNTWEVAAVPYIPVPDLIEEHLENLEKEGVKGLILSWTLGGCPGGNLPLLHRKKEEIAKALFSPPLAEKVCKVWKLFSEAFRNFPFHNGSVLYRSPVNYGPKNPLYLEKTSYTASMLGFPYDDLESWRGPYSQEIFLTQFKLLTEGWKKALDLLLEGEPFPGNAGEEKAFGELASLGETIYIHLRSTYLQAAFIVERDSLTPDRERMKELVKEEIALAKRMHFLASRDSRLGFEASNHYFYTLNDLREKIISCAFLLERLSSK